MIATQIGNLNKTRQRQGKPVREVEVANKKNELFVCCVNSHEHATTPLNSFLDECSRHNLVIVQLVRRNVCSTFSPFFVSLTLLNRFRDNMCIVQCLRLPSPIQLQPTPSALARSQTPKLGYRYSFSLRTRNEWAWVSVCACCSHDASIIVHSIT